MNMELQIDRLVLEGIQEHQKERVAEALQKELGRLFSEQGIPGAMVKSGDLGAIHARRLKEDTAGDPDLTGTGTARSIYQSFL